MKTRIPKLPVVKIMENEGFKPCHLGDIPDNELQKFLTQMDAVEYKKESLGSLFYAL